jgi:uncharacterized protein DUF4407
MSDPFDPYAMYRRPVPRQPLPEAEPESESDEHGIEVRDAGQADPQAERDGSEVLDNNTSGPLPPEPEVHAAPPTAPQRLVEWVPADQTGEFVPMVGRIDDEPEAAPIEEETEELEPLYETVPPPRRQRYVPNPVAYEPPPPRRFDPGRWLRVLAGVDERLLRQVWFERARHTALGGIILGTALIAGFSMWMAINESIGYATIVTLIPALIWFIFIISLDRALVSTMVGKGRRWGSFLFRLALSIMFGIIIAEPLTIRIFQTAIEQHIQDERTAEIDTLRSNLLRCNTKEIATGTQTAPGDCKPFLLSFQQTPVAKEQELAQKQADEKTLAATVEADNAEDKRLRDMAAAECTGTSGPSLSGVRGHGPFCADRQADVANFEATHPLEANTKRLADLRTEISTLSTEISAVQSTFESTRDTQIAQRILEAKAHQGSIGLLERLKALHALAASTWALLFGTWAVRLFFILADCLPVVVKFSGGSSQYDRIVAAQSANAVRRHEQDLQLLDDEARTHLRKYRSDLEVEVAEHRADAAVRRDDAVGRVERRILKG